MMDICIRQENQQDIKAVESLIKRAFAGLEFSDHTEHLLVTRLRKSEAFVPELSLVAESSQGIIGHILLTKIIISGLAGQCPSLAMAPVSVMPEFQNRGIGSRLINAGHRCAAEQGFESVVVLGHPGYYPKFGYRPASDFGISFPFDVPAAHCMVVELVAGALTAVSGQVVYPPEFFE